MSSDGFFEGDDLDDAFLEQLDAIEAAALLPAAVQPTCTSSAPLTKERSFCDLTLDIDESEFERLDNFIEDTYQGKAQPVAGPSKTHIKNSVQTTLFGDILPREPSITKPRSQIVRTKSASHNPFGQQAPKTKYWDQTAFAKSGLKQGKTKGKGKGKFNEDDDMEDEDVEFEQFPAPFVPVGPPPPMKISPDLLEAKHWIYPLNQPKRDYQYNIVKRCLFDNTIVALPTGLGKTFIAGVVMLNFYRWFPEGKVVFVAPTKPLVAQQIDACHKTCGIPGSDAIELTGQNPRPMRARAWKEKRLFYMTPQTLINDLTSEICDAHEIILLVIDEAHRATGDYAYNQVIRYLMAKNPYFRVLALTATPGGNPEAVQTLIDGLHISRIEIRDENSLDLKAYIHHKTIEQHIIKMSEDVDKVKDLLAKLMNTFINPLKSKGILYGQPNPVTMHTYFPQSRMSSLGPDQKWAYGPLAKLSSLARAMGYLIEGTIGMCYTCLQELSRKSEDVGGDKKNNSKAKKLHLEPMFQDVIRELETQRNRGFTVHPKMDMLKSLIIQHFGGKLGDDETAAEETKVMVFVTFREAVDEIVEALNFERPLIRASKFIGQGTDKQGKKGLAQKEQLAVIEKFKAGEFNVLVATSIGEEGLDIGEVDLIICYDAQKTPIRMLQRVGRTGRKRAGVVHVLLSEGREEFNLDKAKDTYKHVQQTIWRGEELELYADVERLLPGHIKPECLEKKMDIQEYVREEKKATKSLTKRDSPLKKRKRDDDVGRNIPMGASTGFVRVAELLVKGAKKRKKAILPAKSFELAGQDDETDLDIESGNLVAPPRRSKSAVASSSTKGKAKLRKAATADGPKTKRQQKKPKNTANLSSSQFSQKGMDDSDDMEIEQSLVPRPSVLKGTRSFSRQFSSPHPPPQQALSSKISVNSVINLSDTDSGHLSPEVRRPIPSPPGISQTSHDESMAWLVDEDEDEEPNIEIVDSSPLSNKRLLSPVLPQVEDESIEFIEPPLLVQLDIKLKQPQGAAFDLDESIEFVGSPVIMSTANMVNHRANEERAKPDDSIEFIIENSVSLGNNASSPAWHLSSSPVRRRSNLHRNDMPPPDMPLRRRTPSPLGHSTPDLSYPIQRVRKRILHFTEPKSPILDMPVPSQRRLHRLPESSPAQRSKRQNKAPKLARQLNPLFDIAAVHSGDEVSEGSSHSDDDMESESDRMFANDFPETQVSPSYDQSLAYRQSLFTQAAIGGKAPVFANRIVRRGAFGGLGMSSRRRLLVSSSPPRERDDDEPDEYAVGSFVVDDDAEILYE